MTRIIGYARRDQEDHSSHGVEPGVTTRLSFSRLEQSVNGLDEPACLT